MVLSRKPGETLRIGDSIVLSITRINGNRVTIGIQAPKETKIVRGELPPLEAQPVANVSAK